MIPLSISFAILTISFSQIFLCIGLVAAQSADGSIQLFGAGDLEGVSPNCESALIKGIKCPFQLLSVALNDGTSLTADQIPPLCDSTCSDSISAYQNNVSQACGSEQWIDPEANYSMSFAALAGYWFTGYDAACVKDSNGDYCYGRLYGGNTPTGENVGNSSLNSFTRRQNKAAACDECNLKVLQARLQDSWGFDDAYAADFASLTDSCGVATMTFTAPTSVFIASATGTASALPTCTGKLITLNSTDSCDTIAAKHKISTHLLTSRNGLIQGCADFPKNGSLCVEGECNTYRVTEGDTCRSVTQINGISIAQLTAWNYNIDPACTNFNQSIGHVICLSDPYGYVPRTSQASSPATATTDAILPANTGPGSNKHCGKWYPVIPGDNCGTVIVANAITLDDFKFLNPGINQNCTNMWANYQYCVLPVGDISNYPGYSDTGNGENNNSTISSTSFPTASLVDYSNATGTRYTPVNMPKPTATQALANGSRTDCFQYYPAAKDQSCAIAVYTFGMSYEEFVLWNPSVGDLNQLKKSGYGSCSMKAGYRYCALLNDPSIYAPSTTSEGNPYPERPTNAASDSTSTCLEWLDVSPSDTCETILSDNKINLADFYRMNPAVGSNCENLWKDTSYCVSDDSSTESDGPQSVGSSTGTPANASATTTDSAATSLADHTATSEINPPASTVSGNTVEKPTGFPSDCTQFHTVTTDETCDSIAQSANIPTSKFIEWNPEVGDNCENLWLNNAYCVARPGSTPLSDSIPAGGQISASESAPKPTGVAPPGPTQDGIDSHCNKYIMQQDGVFCDDMAGSAGISVDQLHTWNPALQSDCTGLWIGYAYCVGVSS